MGKLTIEEAIKYLKEVVRKNRKNNEKNTIIIPNSFISSDDCAEKYEQVAEWLEELKAFKDAEEQGLLVRLPCKVGDMVYKLWYYDGKPYKIQQHVIRTLSELCGIMEAKKLGKSVFLTREEAEKKLEEMKNGK